MRKTILLRTVTLLLVLAISFGITASAMAAPADAAAKEAIDGKYVDAEARSVNPFLAVWDTLTEAKTYYGYEFDYVYEGYNAAYGWFLYYYTHESGEKIHFACLVPS